MNVTVGMATYNEFDALFFTVQHLRAFHLLPGDEIVVVDNFGCDKSQQFCEKAKDVRYVRCTETQGTAAPRERVIAEAANEVVICIDSHVLLLPGAVAAVRTYFEANPESKDLVQGPLVYDDLTSISTHFTNEWGNQMFGQWGTDERGQDPEGEPFDIWNMGMGAFSCLKKSWVGFNPNFRGFGGEEGYIHEKFRQHGGRTLCLPAFRWNHKFARQHGIAYKLTVEEKLRNHLIGWEENSGDLSGVLQHFAQHAPHENCLRSLQQAMAATGRADLYDMREIVRLSGVAVPDEFPASVDATPVAGPLVTCFMTVGSDDEIDEYRLRTSVQAFVQQNYPNTELVIVNNASPYQIKTYAARTRILQPRAQLRTIESMGRYILENSSGTYLVTWPIDMAALPNRISTLVDAIGDLDMLEEPNSGGNSIGFSGIITRVAFNDLVKPLTSKLMADERSFTVGASEENLVAAVDPSAAPLFPVRPPVWVTESAS